MSMSFEDHSRLNYSSDQNKYHDLLREKQTNSNTFKRTQMIANYIRNAQINKKNAMVGREIIANLGKAPKQSSSFFAKEPQLPGTGFDKPKWINDATGYANKADVTDIYNSGKGIMGMLKDYTGTGTSAKAIRLGDTAVKGGKALELGASGATAGSASTATASLFPSLDPVTIAILGASIFAPSFSKKGSFAHTYLKGGSKR